MLKRKITAEGQEAAAETKRIKTSKPRVHGDVVRKLGSRIVGGGYAPGAALPNEAALSAELGVSRGSLREAVKVLASKGLVEARPRTGMRVRERACWDLLDPAVIEWNGDAPLEPGLVRSLVEARHAVEPAAAALAARYASPAEIEALSIAYDEMARWLGKDAAAAAEADLAFHTALLKASNNLVFRRLLETITAALHRMLRHSVTLTESLHALDDHRLVLEAIRARDTEAAYKAMGVIVDKSERMLKVKDGI